MGFLVKTYYCFTNMKFWCWWRNQNTKPLKKVGICGALNVGRNTLEINLWLYLNNKCCHHRAEPWPLQESYSKRIESSRNGWLSRIKARLTEYGLNYSSEALCQANIQREHANTKIGCKWLHSVLVCLQEMLWDFFLVFKFVTCSQKPLYFSQLS